MRSSSAGGNGYIPVIFAAARRPGFSGFRKPELFSGQDQDDNGSDEPFRERYQAGNDKLPMDSVAGYGLQGQSSQQE
jgi:hypothetical protein